MTVLRDILKKDYVISLEDGVKLLGNDKALYRLVEKGVLKKVEPKGLGYFCFPELEEGVAHFAIINKYYPMCVVSGKTALSLYGLGLDYISKIDVDIPNKTNLLNEMLNVHRVVEAKINGVVERSFEDKGVPFKIKIYSPERCLFEARKYYKGLDSYFYALKTYRDKYLDKAKPGEQFDIILRVNKKTGREIIDLLMMET
jgi:predicted transcriptional regulator of viral defense system